MERWEFRCRCPVCPREEGEMGEESGHLSLSDEMHALRCREPRCPGHLVARWRKFCLRGAGGGDEWRMSWKCNRCRAWMTGGAVAR